MCLSKILTTMESKNFLFVKNLVNYLFWRYFSFFSLLICWPFSFRIIFNTPPLNLNQFFHLFMPISSHSLPKLFIILQSFCWLWMVLSQWLNAPIWNLMVQLNSLLFWIKILDCGIVRSVNHSDKAQRTTLPSQTNLSFISFDTNQETIWFLKQSVRCLTSSLSLPPTLQLWFTSCLLVVWLNSFVDDSLWSFSDCWFSSWNSWHSFTLGRN